MNVLNIGKKTLAIAVLIAALAIVPLASSYIYWGGGTHTVKNNDDNSTYTADLRFYGDTFDSNCSDTDTGIKPDVNGTTSWFDHTTSTSYSAGDYCVNGNILREYGCAKDFTIDGNQYHDYATEFDVNCSANGFSSCGVNKCQ
jgi:hypothetical protein